MTKSNADALRTLWTTFVYSTLADKGEDVGMISSHAVNFPVVTPDGEEGWVRLVIEVPTKADSDDEYAKRTEWENTLAERKLKAFKAEQAKAKRLAEKAEKAEKKG